MAEKKKFEKPEMSEVKLDTEVSILYSSTCPSECLAECWTNY